MGTSTSSLVITDKRFWRHAGLVVLAVFLFLLLVFLWLRVYTNHGQRLTMPDYTGQILETAMKDAKARSFSMVAIDSIHIVGRRGHEIIMQNPLPNAQVKENRTIYVTITKLSADQIPLSRLPSLYGKRFDSKEKELKQGFDIQSEIAGRMYDPGDPDHILAVIYKGDTIIDKRTRGGDVMIDRGGTLRFVLSQSTGGRLPIPDLICMTYSEAQFLIESSGLEIAEVVQENGIVDIYSAYVSGQVPDPAEGMIEQGSGVRLSLSREKPLQCQ